MVDDGSFHKVLDAGVITSLKLINDIPVCCKINLEGQNPPLHIKVSGSEKKHKIQAFASYKEVEPTLDNAELIWLEIKDSQLRIPGERGPKPNTKIFRYNQLYLTLISA